MASTQTKQTGFTIVELLIVIVVIGILAAITVVGFRGIQNRANDTAVQSDLRSIGTQMAMYKTIHSTYPGTKTLLEGMTLKLTRSAYAGVPNEAMNMTYCISSGAAEYAVFAFSKSGTLYTVDHTNAVRSIPYANISSCGGVTGLSRTGTDTINIDAGYYEGVWRAWAND